MAFGVTMFYSYIYNFFLVQLNTMLFLNITFDLDSIMSKFYNLEINMALWMLSLIETYSALTKGEIPVACFLLAHLIVLPS